MSRIVKDIHCYSVTVVVKYIVSDLNFKCEIKMSPLFMSKY
jgi:hypothetical protein